MLLQSASRFEEIDEIPGVWDALLDGLSTEGIEQVIYISVDGNRENPIVLTNVPDVYADTDPATDPFLSHICKSYEIAPTGPDYLVDYDYLPDTAKRFIREAGKVNWRTGLGIPMRLQGSERFGGFNLGSPLPRAEFEARILPRAEAFRFICLLAHRRMEELARGGAFLSPEGFRDLLVAPMPPMLEALSPREKEVIYLVAQGVSRKECARLCGISPNTVADYTKSAYRKLGVHNRAEAARLVFDRSPA